MNPLRGSARRRWRRWSDEESTSTSRSTPMSDQPISPLRRRIIEHMTVRNFVEKTRYDYIQHVRTRQYSCHYAITPKLCARLRGQCSFRKITRHANPVPRPNPDSAGGTVACHFPQFRSLKAFGRRPRCKSQRRDRPASETLNRGRHWLTSQLRYEGTAIQVASS